jgi:hypothetical protein
MNYHGKKFYNICPKGLEWNQPSRLRLYSQILDLAGKYQRVQDPKNMSSEKAKKKVLCGILSKVDFYIKLACFAVE